MSDAKLCVPETIYAAVGLETGLYFEQMILSMSSWEYVFKVKCDIGMPAQGKWVVTPTETNIGKHNVVFEVYKNLKLLDVSESVITVPSPTAGTGKNINILLVGDSLTHATIYPNRLADLLDLPGNSQWKMLGTNAFISDEKFSATVNHESGYVNQTRKQKVLHEGWGGKTWKWHLQEGKFCHPGGQIDIARYLDEYCNGDRPDIVIFMLGINDCFTADANQPEKAVSECVGYSEKLISEFRSELPASQIGICLIPGPNQFESSFESCYAGEYTRWGWKKIQHALNKNIIEHYGRRGGENISLIATSLVVDPVLGYPYDNGVHPNEYGYNQLADQIYGWIKTVV